MSYPSLNCRLCLSDWHDETLGLGEFFLIRVEGEELFRPQLNRSSYMKDVHGMMTAGIGVEFAEAFGSEVDLRPRCRDKPSSAQPPRQFIRTQSRNLLHRENAVAPRFPQSRHDVHFG